MKTTRGRAVWTAAVIVAAGCAGILGRRPPDTLRGYEILVEGRDSLSEALVGALHRRGFTVRRAVRGGGRATAALVWFTYSEVAGVGGGGGPPKWLLARLADTRSGAIVGAATVLWDSAGTSPAARAEALAGAMASP